MFDIVQELLEKNKLSLFKLSKLSGVPYTTLVDWKNGKYTPKIDKIEKIANFFGVSPNYIMTGEKDETHYLKDPKISKLIFDMVDKEIQEKLQSPHPYISILGRVIAGVPVEAVEDVIGKIQINEKLARTGSFYALEVKGNSMQPRLQEGDVVVVKEQSDVENGQIAIVCVNGDEYTIKKIKKSENGITLIPFNPAYDTIFYSNEEIEKLPVEIKGRVVQFHGNL